MTDNFPQETSPKSFTTLWIVLLIVAGILAYSNSFNVPFHFDDYPNIVENPALKIRSLSFNELSSAARHSPSSAYRWVANLSLALNYYFHGLDVR
ncbi:hypothetical protein ACFL6N_01735, partial [Thermodesulfobacteriota bacterium]